MWRAVDGHVLLLFMIAAGIVWWAIADR